MLAVGGHPFQTSSRTDNSFKLMMSGGVAKLLGKWKLTHYVNLEMAECIQSMLKYEGNRADLEGVKECAWLRGE